MMKRRKTVLTIHDCVFMNHPSSMARFIFRWFWLRLPIRQSAVVTVVSQVTKDEVLRHVSCDPRKIRVIPNFVSGRFSFSPAEFNQSLPTILHIGTAPNKNLERLIAAIEGLSCRLLIVGKLTPLHRDLLKQHRVDFENVFNIDEEELVRVYQRCDMLSFVSTYEGFGMPILEAQITGRPVITSNLSSMPSVAGEGALLVNPYEEKDIRQGIVKIINDAHFRNQLIGKGKDNARRFSLKETIGQYEHIYRELLQDLEK